MCLKFQLTSMSTRPTVAMAMCWASARILTVSTPAATYASASFLGLGIKLERLDVRLGHGGKSLADLGRCRGELLHRQGRQDEDTFTSDEGIHEPDGVLGELVVHAATQDRRVRVDPQLHSRILSKVIVSMCLILPRTALTPRSCPPNA